MTPEPGDRYVDAARREVRVRAWDATKVDVAWRELQHRQRQKRARQHQVAKIGGTAFAFVAVLALGFGALRLFAPAPTETASSSQLPLEVPQVERIAFDEGTEVQLLDEARVDVVERTDERVVIKMRRGSAHFRVRHDPTRVFRVEAGDVIVEDLGTVFVVDKGEHSAKVSVSEGEVAVSFIDDGQRRRLQLSAGQSGEYRFDGGAANEAAPAATERPDAGAQSGEPATVEVKTPEPDKRATADWRALARAREYRQAYELIAPRGFRDVRNEPGDLLLASDVARLSRHPAESATFLRRLLEHHATDPRAPSAAFTLGWVLMSELGRAREAAVAFGRVRSLAPHGNLAEDALARSIEAWYRAGELGRAEAEVRRYRKLYPKGRHQAMLERLVGTQ